MQEATHKLREKTVNEEDFALIWKAARNNLIYKVIQSTPLRDALDFLLNGY